MLTGLRRCAVSFAIRKLAVQRSGLGAVSMSSSTSSSSSSSLPLAVSKRALSTEHVSGRMPRKKNKRMGVPKTLLMNRIEQDLWPKKEKKPTGKDEKAKVEQPKKTRNEHGFLEWWAGADKSALLREMVQAVRQHPTYSPYVTLFVQYVGDMQLVQETKELMLTDLGEKFPVQSLDGFFHILMKVFAENGEIDKALETLYEAQRINLHPQLRSYREILRGMRTENKIKSREDLEKQERLFKQAKQNCCDFESDIHQRQLDEETYIQVLGGRLNAAKHGISTSDQALVEDALRRFDSVLAESISDVYYPSQELFALLRDRFSDQIEQGQWLVRENCMVNKVPTKCEHCSVSLRSMELSDADREALKGRMKGTTGIPDNVMDGFRNWLKQMEKKGVDCFVDVANVAYYGHHEFNYFTANAVIQKLKLEKKNVALIAHCSRIKNKRVKGSRLIQRIIDGWKEDNRLYVAPQGTNDDWFLLLGALTLPGRVLLVTNDLFRDHHYNMLGRRHFNIWRERHIAKYDFAYDTAKRNVNGIQFFEPPYYSIRSQTEFSGEHLKSYHAPHIPEESAKDPSQIPWFCVFRGSFCERRKTNPN